MKDKKKIAIIITLLIGIITAYGITKIFIDKKEKPIINEVKKDKRMAIMVQSGDGYKEYVSKDDTWPGSDYVFKKAECVDNAGNKIDGAVTFAEGKATVKSNKTIYCTLYFDEKPPELITNANKICDMGTSMSIELETTEKASKYYYSTNGKDFVESNENIYSLQGLKAGTNQKIYVYVTDSKGKQSETKEYDFTTKTLGKSMTASELKASNPKDLYTKNQQGGMYRYQGTDNVDNWIVFGTNECTNDYAKNNIDKYMYRIIGITDSGEMKLIKETVIKEESTNTFAWNDRYYVDPESKYYCPNDKCPDWPDSQLFKRLNGTSNGRQTGVGQELDKEWTDIYVDSEYYDYLRSGDEYNGGEASEWYKLISNHQWLYGDTNDRDALDTYNGDAMYAIESGAKDATHLVGTKGNITEEPCNWKDNPTLIAKIGLMYVHDYYYSYYDGTDEKTRGNAENISTIKNSWIFFRKDGQHLNIF